MRTCSREQQLAGLATTPMQGEYCGSTTPVLRQKIFVNTGLEKNYRIYLIIVVYSRIQPNERFSLIKDSIFIKVSTFLKETRGPVPAAPSCPFRRPVASSCGQMSGQPAGIKPANPAT
jgi:hypothetical protein